VASSFDRLRVTKTKHRKSRRPEAGVNPGGCSGGAQTVARRPASWVISALFDDLIRPQQHGGGRRAGGAAGCAGVGARGAAGGGIASSCRYIIFARVCSVS